MKAVSLKQLFIGCSVILVLLVVHKFFLSSYFSLSWLQENVHYLQQMVIQHYWYVVAMYLAAYIGTASCGMPGSTFFIIAAGLLFGLVPGICIAMLGLVSGATILFLISRYAIGSWVQQRYKHKLTSCNRAIEQHGYYYMLFVRMLAVLPFGMLNILAGVTLLPVKTFVWTTATGMFPYVLLYVFAGQQLGNLASTDTMFSSPMMVFVTTLVLRVSLLPIIVRYIIKTRRGSATLTV